jgi:cytochrome oxidase assembly protein ShyY1
LQSECLVKEGLQIQAKAWKQQQSWPFFMMIAKEEVLDRLVKNFWMETDTPQDDDYATPIAEDLIMMKMRKTMKILPDGHIQLPTLWKEELPQRENNYEYAKTRLFSL